MATGTPAAVHLALALPSQGRVLRGAGTIHRIGGAESVPGPPPPGSALADAGGFLLVEHLLGAAFACGVLDFECELPLRSVPLLDGSARTWASAFRRLRPPDPHGGARVRCQAVAGGRSGRGGWATSDRLAGFRFSAVNARGGSLEARADERFNARVAWSRGPRGQECFALDQGSPTFQRDLAACLEARTFVEANAFCGMAAAGWRSGADAMAGRLLRGSGSLGADALALARRLGVDASDPVWIGGADRVADECAAHKMLDLLGDIAQSCATFPPLRIIARDAGHDLHLELAQAIHARLHAPPARKPRRGGA